jgi:uncharacterized protein (DUF433 family)
MNTPPPPNWKYLGPKPGSTYRQLFVKGRNVAARTIFGDYMSEEEPRTPEQIAEDRDLPLAAILEAIAYCQSDPPEIRQDWEEEEALERARILNDPTYYFPGIEEKRAQILAEEGARTFQRA